MRTVCPELHERDKDRRLLEQIIHFLQWPLSGLGQECPEKEGIGEIADLWVISLDSGLSSSGDTYDKDKVILPANVRECNWRDLANQSIEGEAHHCCNRDTLGPGASVEYLCWHDLQ